MGVRFFCFVLFFAFFFFLRKKERKKEGREEKKPRGLGQETSAKKECLQLSQEIIFIFCHFFVSIKK